MAQNLSKEILLGALFIIPLNQIEKKMWNRRTIRNKMKNDKNE